MQFYTNLLKIVLNTLMTDVSVSDSNEETSVENEEFVALMERKPSSKELVLEYFGALLSHEDIQSYFLSPPTLAGNKTAKMGRKLCHLLSTTVAELISRAPKDSITSTVSFYFKEKTLLSMNNTPLSENQSVILLCVSAFCKYFKSHEVTGCLQFLLNLSRDTLIKGEQLTNYGKLIVTLMKTLLQKSSEVFLFKCPIDVLRNLVHLLEETSCPGTAANIFSQYISVIIFHSTSLILLKFVAKILD